MNLDKISEEKKKLRKEMRRSQKDFLDSLSEREKFSLAESLAEKITALEQYKKSALVFAYIPDSLEADCRPVILEALEKGKEVAVPKVDLESAQKGISRMNFYFLNSGRGLEDQLEKGAYGILEPKKELVRYSLKTGKITPKEAFMIVPGVAFTESGKRLGHGKGFYDIYIEELRASGVSPFLCGTALPCQIVPNLPTNNQDILMDTVIF